MAAIARSVLAPPSVRYGPRPRRSVDVRGGAFAKTYSRGESGSSDEPEGRTVYLIGRNEPYRRYFGVHTIESDRKSGAGPRPYTHLVAFDESAVAVDMACHMTEDDRVGKSADYVLEHPNIDLLLLLKLCRPVDRLGEETADEMESTFLHAVPFADAERMCRERGLVLTVLGATLNEDNAVTKTHLAKHYPKADYAVYASALDASWDDVADRLD
eukprot:jgi/Mesvir1/22476/Mv04284-RA.1